LVKLIAEERLAPKREFEVERIRSSRGCWEGQGGGEVWEWKRRGEWPSVAGL
jgi:hypothetical protein